MILVVCLNLAVDEIIEVDHLQIGQVHRSLHTRRQAGSKGVNVARVLGTLGAPCILTGFLGGEKGEFIARDLEREKISFKSCPIRNESRTCFILHDHKTNRQTVINEPGAEISSEEFSFFTESYQRLLEGVELVVISGSLPPGLNADTYAQLISMARDANKRTLLDSSGFPLSHAVQARPHLLKINHEEAAALLDQPVYTPSDAARAVDRLLQMGIDLVMITIGAEGAVFASKEGQYLFTPPQIEARNSVGSGDAALAGLAAGLFHGDSLQQLGALSMAAGAANALHGGGHCTLDEITVLKAKVRCTPLSREVFNEPSDRDEK